MIPPVRNFKPKNLVRGYKITGKINFIKKVLSEADKIKKELNESLNERENELLEKYTNKISEIDDLFLRQTFEKGVFFASSFLVEVLHNK